MTTEIKILCNLCRREIKQEKLEHEYPDGWPLKWCGPGSHLPEIGATLEPVGSWRECPIHLCQVCVQAVGKFRDSAANCNALIPAPD